MKTAPTPNSICFCRLPRDSHIISCDNKDCPYGKFHPSCLGFTCSTPKTWICPHCSRLPPFKRRKTTKQSNNIPSKPSLTPVVVRRICICNSVPSANDRLLECHNQHRVNGQFFHLSCIGYKKMRNNSKTNWQCTVCRTLSPITTDKITTSTATTGISTAYPTTCTSTTAKTLLSMLSSTIDNGSDDEIEFSKELVGQVDKANELANLTQDDFEIILDPNGWLHSSIIQKAQVLLKKVNPLVEGFQKPTLGPVRNFDVVSGEFVQILHTGRDHWVCISSIGCLAGQVNLYDSLYNDVILQEVVDQAKDLVARDLISLNYVPTQQQNNGSDCGVYAIAFATCLVFGIDLKYVSFDIVEMRPHLASCLHAEKIELFPYF